MRGILTLLHIGHALQGFGIVLLRWVCRIGSLQ
jgi:hypothetical protein